MTTFYFQNENPKAIIRELCKLANEWSCKKIINKSENPILVDEVFLNYKATTSLEIFNEFKKMFNVIRIESGQPRGDYGQTINIDAESAQINPESFPVQGKLSKAYVKGQMTLTENYRYKEETFAVDINGQKEPISMKEEFFFEYQPGQEIKCFMEIIDLLDVAREISTTMHKISTLEFVLMERGIYIKIVSRVHDNQKTPFQMDS